jgi:polyisoprenoid-binding protein YceI
MEVAMSFRLFVLCFLIIPCEVLPQQKLYRVRQEDSHVGFSIYKWMVIKEEGRFREFDGTITYDPNDASALRVEFAVNAKSIDSRNESRDRALRSPDFFDVARHPLLEFKSTEAVPRSVSELHIVGDLTIRGVTKRVTIPVKIVGTHHVRGLGELIGFETTFTINREEYGVGNNWSPGTLGKEVTIHLLIGAVSTGTSANR